jgi:signal transduction histidine kinase/CheY-like chemotaxis protein
MSEPAADLRSELGISAKPVIVALVVVALVSIWSHHPDATLFGLFLYASCAIMWLLNNYAPRVSQWFALLTLLAAVLLMNLWLGIRGAVALVALPVALAPSLISLPAAAATALAESLIVLVLRVHWRASPGLATIAVDLTAIWGTLACMYAAYLPMHRLLGWLEGYFGNTRRSVEETRDQTAELKEAIERLRNANRQLALANERTADLRAIAEEAQLAKTAFVSNVSHEFRTPLNMIIGLVDLIMERPEMYSVVLSPEMRDDLRVIHRNCEHLSSMIDDVLDLTRVEAGHVALKRERVDLKGIIEDSVEAVHPLLKKKHLSLEIAVPDDLPLVYCDRTRIQQVVLNLVSNAVRFTDEGEIAIEVTGQEDEVLVSVADTGRGISSEDKERIFEPFYQTTGSDNFWDRKEGSGLGLSISKRFVTLHGGRMWLESELGRGSTFCFSLPVSAPMERAVRAEHLIMEDWVWRERAFRTDGTMDPDELAKPRIVICDEAAVLYPQLARYSDRIEFVETRDLTELRQELGQSIAHAVIINAKRLECLWPLVESAKQETAEMPILGSCVPDHIEQALSAGALGYLVKPVTRADLAEAVGAVDRDVRRVLVVDDSPDALRLFSRMLSTWDEDLDVVTASSGAQALEELRRTPPDLMLLDIVMPGMNGWQVLERMNQDEAIEKIPTYIISAQDPGNEPPSSRILLATIGGGIGLDRLLRCALDVSANLVKPESELGPTPL